MSAIKPRAGAPGQCVQCAWAVGSQQASPHAGRDGGFGLWLPLVFSELWIRIEGWELVTPH